MRNDQRVVQSDFPGELLVVGPCGVDCCLHAGFLLSPKFLESPTQLRRSTLHKCQRNVFQSEARGNVQTEHFLWLSRGDCKHRLQDTFSPIWFLQNLYFCLLWNVGSGRSGTLKCTRLNVACAFCTFMSYTLPTRLLPLLSKIIHEQWLVHVAWPYIFNI